MSRVQDIIDEVRTILHDENNNNYRWSNDKLIQFMNSGIKDFVLNTKILRERFYMSLEENAALYDLSNYILEFERIQFGNKTLEVKTQEEMDSIKENWQDEVGAEVKYAIFSDLKPGILRIYPRAETGLNSVVTNSIYGGVVDLVVNDDLFQIPSIGDAPVEMENYLIIYAIKKPNKLTIDSTDSEFELDSMYDMALIYFITASALRSDTDTLNRQFGAEQFQLYRDYVTKATSNRTKNYNVVPSRTIKYAGGF